MIGERINALRAEMKKRGMDAYYIPTSDYHETEYVGEFFKARKYMTGFTGSAGVAVITMEDACLWTDGRYFIQAERQLKDTPVRLMRMAQPGVPTVKEYLVENLKEGAVLGFDGRVVNIKEAESWEEALAGKNITFDTDEDLVGIIWKDRPALPKEPVYLLDEKYSGRSAEDKLMAVRMEMEKNHADIHVLSTLDNICWLLNIRGNDVPCFPVVLSFLIMDREKACLYVNEETINDTVREALQKINVSIADYNKIYEDVSAIPAGKTVMMDFTKANLHLLQSVKEGVNVIHVTNPEVLMQAVKNQTELENIRKAHVMDGVACTKFMYWLKKNIGKMEITEISASDYLEKLRRENEGFIELSFDTISAYGANAAMMHYCATEDNFAVLKPESFLLVDSGAHYLTGSTDITRTIALGPVTDEQKKMFTTVLRSNMNLTYAHFQYGCRGANLDILARGPMWDMGLDYRCGTGHGIGYILNVHEAPNGFRWKVVPERNDSCVLEEGMVTTNEPGYYEEGGYGIRTENEMICVKGPETEYGQFMEFETITFCPIDLDAVDPDLLTSVDKDRLNSYHKMVYEKVSPYLDEEEKEWLKVYTRAI